MRKTKTQLKTKDLLGVWILYWCISRITDICSLNYTNTMKFLLLTRTSLMGKGNILALSGPSGTGKIRAYYKLLDPPKIKKNRVDHQLGILVKKRTELKKQKEKKTS